MARPETPSDPPIQVATMASGRFSYTDEGDGPVVVAVPGYPGGPRDFRWLAPALGADVRVVRLAMPGFEQTPLTTEPGTGLLERARFIARAVEALDLPDVLMVGHSMGGGLAGMATVELGTRVRGLGLICSIGPIAHPSVRGPGVQRVSRMIRRPVIGWPVRKMLPGGFRRMGFPPRWNLAQLTHTIHCAAALHFPDWAAHIDQLHCPTLVSWGEDDPLVPASISRMLAERAPDGPRLPFDDGGHSIQKHHSVELGFSLRQMLDLPGQLP